MINVEDQILQTIDRYGVRRVEDLPPREALGAPGPDQPYRMRVPLLAPVTQEVVDLIAAGAPTVSVFDSSLSILPTRLRVS